MMSPRLPRTTWEYSLSAAGELVGWYLPQDDGEPQPAARETAVLLAAAVYALAADAGVNGAQVATLPLASPAGQTGLLTTLHDHVLSALQVLRDRTLVTQADVWESRMLRRASVG
ncbi:hypothetical protein [Streptomyces sp. NPDC046942]|uniref:hypothetical protein n=1 Tax=Streptomyces sp. NPDC046942 TaxID=3155137 RepID=UPI0033FECB62